MIRDGVSVYMFNRRTLSVAKTGIAGGWNSANQSPRFTAYLSFLTEDVHGIPEERMPIVERYPVAVAGFCTGLIAVPVVTYR